MTMLSVPRPSTPASQAQTDMPRSQRLVSLDALRGFDMFWIIGGEEIFHEWVKVQNWAILQHISNQLDHTPWAGLIAYDLVFSTFIFIFGASLDFLLMKDIAVGLRADPMRDLLVR